MIAAITWLQSLSDEDNLKRHSPLSVIVSREWKPNLNIAFEALHWKIRKLSDSLWNSFVCPARCSQTLPKLFRTLFVQDFTDILKIFFICSADNYQTIPHIVCSRFYRYLKYIFLFALQTLTKLFSRPRYFIQHCLHFYR